MKKIFLAVMITAIMATGCSRHASESVHPKVSGVGFEIVKKEPITSFYTTSATVKSKINSVVSAMLMGKVTSLAVQEGDYVQAGQLLLTIDARDLAQKASGASAGVRAAQMAANSAAQNMKMAEKTYDRYKKLYDEKVITKQEFDQYLTQKNVAGLEYQRALAGVQQARAGLGEVNVYQGYARVSAPVSGIVIQKNIDLGSTAIQGMPLLTIQAVGKAAGDSELVANVDESYLDKIKLNQEVQLEAGNKTFKGKITKIVKYIDPQTRTFKVKVDVFDLAGGQFVKISIPVSQKEGILAPMASIVKRGELEGVYVVDNEGLITYRLVRTGKTYGEKVEILSGLSGGEKIINKGLEQAVDGGKISE